MATTLYLVDEKGSSPYYYNYGKAFPRLMNGADNGLYLKSLDTSRGAQLKNYTGNTVSGTVGDDLGPLANAAYGYLSAPLAADVTISGTVTLNGWGYESSMSANYGLGFRIFKVAVGTNTLTEILNSANGTEFGTTTNVYNWTATPTSTSFNRGDRILVVPYGDAVGTAAASYTWTFSWNSPSSGSQGDTYVTFNENLTFQTSTPGGSTLYLTNNSAGISPGNTAYSAWTTPNSSYQYATTNTATGFTNPIQTTVSAGGSAVEWYTPQLTAFTLEGPFQIQANASESNAAANVGVRCEIAITASDGSSATVWGTGGNIGEIATTDSNYNFLVSGDTTSISNGQRLRFRFFFDDASAQSAALADYKMVSGYTARLVYNGSSATTLVMCTETLTEYSSSTTYNGTFTADANIAKNDIAGSFTANANISKTDIPGSFTANAYVRKNDIPGTFTADATIVKTTSGTFTADAFIKNTLSNTFTADATITKTYSGSFTADAFVSKTTESTFTADATIAKQYSNTFTADAYVKKTTSGTFTADAYIKRTFVYGVGGGGTVASEDFEGSGGTGLAGTTAETGGVWSNVAGTNAYITLSGNGTANYLGSVNTSGRARLDSVVLGNGDAVWLNGGGTGSYAGVILRYKTDSDTGYGWEGHNDNEGNGDWNLFRLNSGSATNIGSGYIYNSGVDVSLPYWIRMRVEGSSPTLIKVKVWQDGSSEPGSWNVVDTSDNTAGNQVTSAAVGIHISRESYFGSGDIAQFDVTADGGSVDGTGPTVDAYISKTTSGSVTANAFIKNTLSGTFTADSHIASTVSGTFTADANISSGLTTYTGSFTADAYVQKTIESSFTADANVKNTLSSSFTADAYIQKTLSGSFTADAYVSKTTSGTFTADAYIKNTIGGTFSADATIAKTYPGSFTADAYVKQTIASTFTADATVSKTYSGSFTADAYIVKTFSGSLTADAYIHKTVAGSFTADATVAKTYSGSFTADAYISKTLSGSVTADAYVLKTTEQTFTADSHVKNTLSGSFSADAHISKTVSGTFTADAVIAKQYSGSVTADAFIQNTLAASFTADATIAKTTAGTFTADAYIKQTIGGSLTAEAYILKTISGSVTADAFVQKTSGFTFAADAFVQNTLSGSFTADAYVQRVEQGSFTADATIQKTQSGTFTVDAHISKVGRIYWTTPGDTDAITSTPTFAFRIPPATGNIHFHIELDTVNTFDGASYRSYKSAFDQTGWEYHNGSTWVAVPATGVPNTYAGNEARYTVQTALANATWYRRVRGGV